MDIIISLAISLRIVGWVLGSPERSPSTLDVVIADVKRTSKSKGVYRLVGINTKNLYHWFGSNVFLKLRLVRE